MNGFRPVLCLLCAAALKICFLSGCSVKEDRELCPCYISFDLSEAFDSTGGNLLLTLCNSGGFRFCDTLRRKDYPDSAAVYVAAVPKGAVMMDVYSPADSVRTPFEGYRPEGICAPMRMQSENFIAEGETAKRKIRLNKRYCRLKLSFKGRVRTGVSHVLVFRSETEGYLPGGAVSEGPYSEEVRADADGFFEINLLRQLRSSLMMDVLDEGGHGRPEILKTVAIGEYIDAAGYDWGKDDLDDLEMEVDFADMKVLFRTAERERTVFVGAVI